MKKILIALFSINLFALPDKFGNSEYKIIMSSQDMRENKNEKMDINKVTEQEMLSRGVATSYINKILDYRDITGGFDKIEDLKKIKGIGSATYKKLTKSFFVGSNPKKKKLNINSADEMILKYYGFSKKESKDILKYLDKNSRINDNIELKKIINKKTYENLKDIITYEGEK